MPWKNGGIDERELVIFKRGRNSTDGDWFHGLTPATYARHLELVRLARERTGRTLEISDGWGAYRPYDAQVVARRVYGNGAAVPGTSSHGGYWEGRETMAMDYSNWSWVYGGNRQSFYEDCRKAGLTPGMISRERNYPDEPWHVIDLNPRQAPSFAGVSSTPAPSEPEKEEEPDMRLINGGESRGIALVSAGYYKSLTQVQADAWSKIIDPPKSVSPDEFDQIRASAVWGDAEYTSSATTADTSVERIAQRVAQLLKQ